MGHIIAIALLSLTGLFSATYSLINLCKIFSCKKQIDAYCMGKERRLTGYSNSRNPIITFSYRYNGKDYYRETRLGVTFRFFKSAVKGEKYKIYINENKPERFVPERKPTIGEIVCLAVGIILLLLAVAIYVFLV
ncbi:MAG: hypothetical protein E7536_04790 [Ruminococcaceae bacterium]|nr:hypothetical protein [Oscillospiraceae bacterium]